MSETPNGSTVQAHSADGDVFDITENVKAAYDLLVASMDWGSGFLDHKEEHQIYDLGERLGFELPEMSCFYKKVTYPDGDACPVDWHNRLNTPERHQHSILSDRCEVRSDND